jgi:hypothetical protein
MKYSPITTEKIEHNVWIAKTKVESPLDCEISMRGETEDNAIWKLLKMLEEE